MHGRIAPDKLNSMRNDFLTTALQAANLTKPPPHTAPPPTPTNEQEAEKKFDHDDHFFIPRRPDNATNAYVRNRVMNDLRYIWEILAKMLNEYEQALNIAADDYDKHDRGKGNDVDEDENYKRGKAAREKDDPTVERSARLENRQIEKETRATAPPQSKTPKANPMRDYRTAGFGERRFKGGPAIDVDAEKKLTEANEKGTDGLARNNDTTASRPPSPLPASTSCGRGATVATMSLALTPAAAASAAARCCSSSSPSGKESTSASDAATP